jgi:CDP-diacylglycerol--glycerol-3-phosphate 3-phosphatidyltransferase
VSADRKFRITANQVTLLRLVLIPIPCWLLYQGTSGQYAALIFATLLGCTDFIDGYLARKHGPTVLGGLMDPIADKVFIAITFLPAVDLHWAPSWLVAALFVREFVVTAARTSYEARGQSLKSSYLARYKTWAQMCGVGMLMLLFTVPPATLNLLLGIGAVVPLLFYLLRLVIAKKRWKGASAFAASFALLLIGHELAGSNRVFALGLMYFIVAVTWASGLGYLSGVGKLRRKGAVTSGELVRLTTAAALPILAVWSQTADLAPKWAIIALVSVELAHGGLDSLLAHHQAQASGLAWGLRLGAECALLGLGLGLAAKWAAPVGAIAAAGIGAVGLVVAFVQNRRFYLDAPQSAKGAAPVDAALSA